MSAWLEENIVVVAAIVLLLVVGSVPAPRGRVAVWAWPVLLAALGVGAAAFKLALRRTDLVAQSTVSSTLKYALSELESARDENVLIVDGGSLAQRGLDAHLLEEELEKRGFRARVVRLALAAANHFERYELHRDIVSKLPASSRGRGRWILLSEACVQYDLQPLAQFHGNSDTTRALHYLTPSNVFYALRAQADGRLEAPAEGPWRWDLARHVSINALNVGEASRLAPLESIKADRGGVPGFHERLKKRFDLKGMKREIRRPTPDPAPPPWLRRIRERRLLDLWGTRLDDVVYFGTPSTRVDDLKYVRGFCEHAEHKCLAPTDAKLYARLESRQFWIDETHLSQKGAREYTTWLARRLIAEDVLLP